MVISILGCGWYGKALAVSLIQKNIIVKGSVTSSDKLEPLRAIGVMPYLIKFATDSQTVDAEFFRCDILVISIPPGIRSGEGGNYLNKIQIIIKTAAIYKVNKIVYISSTGVYGDCNCEVDELTPPLPDTESGSILLNAEKLFQQDTLFKTTILRFAGLVGPGRHPGRFFAGKTNIPNGMAPVNLIHQLDCVGITMAIVEKDVFGFLFNACSPDHPSKAAFYREMALKAGLRIPEFIEEQKKWKVVSSVNLAKLLNYDFKVKRWNESGLFDQ